jgi:lipopolysaccharide transport system ATP-binding protein
MSEIAIAVENLSKAYSIGSKASDNLRETISNRIKSVFTKSSPEKEEFWALKEINFNINKGESIGIIGKNGSGKSTLLKILSRITPPTTGNIKIYGRVSSLLEVGTGFHPDLTGKENIFMNGCILGMKKAEIKRKFDEIVAFSGVERFINTPVKRYSSGMQVRLAFAVAAHLEPEILIIDEVLAVGDAEFQKKCLGKMDEVSKSGRTVLFVSHNHGAVAELCSRAILLKEGKIMMDGNAKKTISTYLEDFQSHAHHFELKEALNKPCYITKIAICNANNQRKHDFEFGEAISVIIEYSVQEYTNDFNIEFNLYRNFNCVFTSFSSDQNEVPGLCQKGNHKVALDIPKGLLKAGNYTFNVVLRRITDGFHIHALMHVLNFSISESLINLTHKGYKEERAGDIVFPGLWSGKE